MGIVSDIFSKSDEDRRRSLEEHEAQEAARQRDALAAANAERAALNREAVLALAPHLLAAVIDAAPGGRHRGVTREELVRFLRLDPASPAARGLSLLLTRESDEQRPADERGVLEEVRQTGKRWEGLRYRRRRH